MLCKYFKFAEYLQIFLGKRTKLCGNCTFSKKFYTRKLGQIMVFYAFMVFVHLKFMTQKITSGTQDL